MIEYIDCRSDDMLYNKYKTYDNFLVDINWLLSVVEDEGLKETICCIAGLGKSKAVNIVKINNITIDKGLGIIIEYCLQHKIETIASCSGLTEDHMCKIDKDGYLSLKESRQARDFIEMVWHADWPLPVLSYDYFIPCIRLSFNRDIIEKIGNKLKLL